MFLTTIPSKDPTTTPSTKYSASALVVVSVGGKTISKVHISRLPLLRNFAVCLKKNVFLCFISNHSNPFVSQVKNKFNIWMFPKNWGVSPQMDGENNGKPWMIWGENPLFLETSIEPEPVGGFRKLKLQS